MFCNKARFEGRPYGGVPLRVGRQLEVYANKKLTKCQAKSAAKGIDKALTASANAKTGVEAAKLFAVKPDQVAAYAAALQQSADAAKAAGATQGANLGAANVKVQCHGKTKAGFTYDLVQNPGGRVLAPAVAGNAALTKGTWLLDPVSLCDNMRRSRLPAQASAAPACYAALGLAVPTP